METEEVEYVFHIDDDDLIDCKIGGIGVKMIIDSGCRSNIITEETWKVLKARKVLVHNQTTKSNKILMPYGASQPLRILGTFEAQIEVGKNNKYATILVVKDGKRNLLGKLTAISLGVLRIGQVNNIDNVPFPKFKNVVVSIPIHPEVRPVSQPYRRVPIPLESKINAKLEELKNTDIIEEVKGTSE